MQFEATNPHPRILVIGALGQIGTGLVEELRHRHGLDRVVAADLRVPDFVTGPFIQLDVTNREQLADPRGLPHRSGIPPCRDPIG